MIKDKNITYYFLAVIIVLVMVLFISNFNEGFALTGPGTITQQTDSAGTTTWYFVPTPGYYGQVNLVYQLTDGSGSVAVPDSATLNIIQTYGPVSVGTTHATQTPAPYMTAIYTFTVADLVSLTSSVSPQNKTISVQNLSIAYVAQPSSPGSSLIGVDTAPVGTLTVGSGPVISGTVYGPGSVFTFTPTIVTSNNIYVTISFQLVDSVFGQTAVPGRSDTVGPTNASISFLLPYSYHTPTAIPVILSGPYYENMPITFTQQQLVGLSVADSHFNSLMPGSLSVTFPSWTFKITAVTFTRASQVNTKLVLTTLSGSPSSIGLAVDASGNISILSTRSTYFKAYQFTGTIQLDVTDIGGSGNGACSHQILRIINADGSYTNLIDNQQCPNSAGAFSTISNNVQNVNTTLNVTNGSYLNYAFFSNSSWYTWATNNDHLCSGTVISNGITVTQTNSTPLVALPGPAPVPSGQEPLNFAGKAYSGNGTCAGAANGRACSGNQCCSASGTCGGALGTYDGTYCANNSTGTNSDRSNAGQTGGSFDGAQSTVQDQRNYAGKVISASGNCGTNSACSGNQCCSDSGRCGGSLGTFDTTYCSHNFTGSSANKANGGKAAGIWDGAESPATGTSPAGSPTTSHTVCGPSVNLACDGTWANPNDPSTSLQYCGSNGTCRAAPGPGDFGAAYDCVIL